MLTSIKAKLVERDIEITLTDVAKELIADAGFDPVYGARPKSVFYFIIVSLIFLSNMCSLTSK